MIDAHLHVWDLTRRLRLDPPGQRSGPQLPPDEAAGELARAGVEGAVLVQADDTLADTAFMLDAARAATPWSRVVGWVRLDTPHEALTQLGSTSRTRRSAACATWCTTTLGTTS